MSSVFKSHTDFPLPGMFHALDDNDPNGSLGTSENDSASTNGSCAGEMAEDPAPCKVSRYVPGLEAAPSQQDKNRLKNERKHQRQKERKVKELRERCHGLLMSRKLDKLVEKLVSMGFPRARAGLVLRMNEGHVERSINFLVENERVSLEEAQAKMLKVDISEEVSRMADLEQKLGYSGFEVQRAVVACEGDIDVAIRWLREHSPSPSPAPQEQHPHQHHQQYQQQQQQQRRASPTTPPPRSPVINYREPALPATNHPAEHLVVHYREPGTVPSTIASFRREPGRPYRDPPGVVVNSTSPRGPLAHSFPGVSNGEPLSPGGGFPLGAGFQEPPRSSPLPPRTANAPFELPAWTMREVPRRSVYTDWRNSHPVNHPGVMNRLQETVSPVMHELYVSPPQKPRAPSFDHPQSLQWPELYDRARVSSSPFQERQAASPVVYNRAPPPSVSPASYDRIQRGGAMGAVGFRSTGRPDDGWNVDRLRSVDYKSIDWSVDGKLSLNPLSLGWSESPRDARTFTKDILPTIL